MVCREESAEFFFLSDDTDVLVHLIHYSQMFHDLGAAKLWIRFGPKKPVAHSSAHTNCHYTRSSTKGSSGSLHRHRLWLSFENWNKAGCFECHPREISSWIWTHALEWWCQKTSWAILSECHEKNTSENSFDELRCSEYRNKDEIFSLPPTSHSVLNPHIYPDGGSWSTNYPSF